MLPYETFQKLLPPALLSDLAAKYQVDAVNQVRLPGRTVFACLLHGLLHHQELTQRLLEETYWQRTGKRADHSSFGKRLATISPRFFRAIYWHLQKRLAPQATEGERRALRLRFVDATVVTLSAKLLAFGLLQRTTKPGHSLRQVKTVFERREDGFPDVLRLCKEPSEKSDCVALGDAMLAATGPGDLWIFDAGCHDRKRLWGLWQRQSFFLTPHTQQALRVHKTLFASEMEGPPSSAPKKGEPTFLLSRVEAATFGNGQETKKEQAYWDSLPLLWITGWRFDARNTVWTPMRLMTNLPLSEDGKQAGPYSFEEVAALYRERWEIEILFKFLKSHLAYDHLLSRSENGIAVLLYMTLILAWLLLWYQRQTGIDRGWRSVKFWLAHDMQEWVQAALRQVTIQIAKPPPEPLSRNTG